MTEEIEFLEKEILKSPWNSDLYLELYLSSQRAHKPHKARWAIEKAFLLNPIREDTELLFFDTLGGKITSLPLVSPEYFALHRPILAATPLSSPLWATLGKGGSLLLWDETKPVLIDHFYGHPTAKHITGSHSYLFLIGDGYIEGWEREKKQILWNSPFPSEQIQKIAWDSLSSHLFCLRQNHLEIWHLSKEGIQWHFELPFFPVLDFTLGFGKLLLYTPDEFILYENSFLEKKEHFPHTLPLFPSLRLALLNPKTVLIHTPSENLLYSFGQNHFKRIQISLPSFFVDSPWGTILTYEKEKIKWFSPKTLSPTATYSLPSPLKIVWTKGNTDLLLHRHFLFLPHKRKIPLSHPVTHAWAFPKGVLFTTENHLSWAKQEQVHFLPPPPIEGPFHPFPFGDFFAFLFEKKDKLALGLYHPKRKSFSFFYLNTFLKEDLYLPPKLFLAVKNQTLFLSSPFWQKSYLLTRKRKWQLLWDFPQAFYGLFQQKLHLFSSTAWYSLTSSHFEHHLSFNAPSLPQHCWLSPTETQGMAYFATSPFPRVLKFDFNSAEFFSLPYQILAAHWSPQGLYWINNRGEKKLWSPYLSRNHDALKKP